tara:strand:+ start:186 stop:665 length:480 start_codon:yes stop_codon:yes gene_type:complete
MFGKNKAAVLSIVFGLTAVTPAVNAQVYHVEKNYNLAQASKAIAKGDLNGGAKYLRRAVRTSLAAEQLETALTDLCAIDYHLGKLNSAEKICSRALRVNRKSWKAYYNRGHVRRALGETEAAETDYLKAAKIAPNELRVQKALAAVSKEGSYKFAEIKD